MSLDYYHGGTFRIGGSVYVGGGGLTLVTFLSALFHEGSGWLVRYVHPDFAWLKVVSFLVLQITLFGLLVALFVGVARPARNGYSGNGGGPVNGHAANPRQ